MPRPSQLNEQRTSLLPVVARAFTELGYRRATTAQLAERCGVQENILYRLWPDKKAMFLAAIDYVYDLSERTWLGLLADRRSDGRGPATRLLEYESVHQGEFGHYRILFSGLGEVDDPEIRAALAGVFNRFHRFLHGQIAAQRRRRGAMPAELAAWALIGLGTVVNIGHELGLLAPAGRKRLLAEVGRTLLGEAGP
jgi:AcrR family transcriptional regulator